MSWSLRFSKHYLFWLNNVLQSMFCSYLRFNTSHTTSYAFSCDSDHPTFPRTQKPNISQHSRLVRE